MAKQKGKSILGGVARELLVGFPASGVKQILGIKPKRKKASTKKPVVAIYKEIHQHKHFHDYKAFQKALKEKK